MKTTATHPTDCEIDRRAMLALDRIREAIDHLSHHIDFPDSLPAGHQFPDQAAERSREQAEGGLLRTALQRGSMLITKESSNRLAAERKSATDDLAGHVGSVLRELNSVRTETTRLLDQRRQLEVYLAALKTELEGLRAEKVELMALKAQVRPHAGTEAEVDLVAQARLAVHGTLPAADTAPAAAPAPVPTAAQNAPAPTSAGHTSSAQAGFTPRGKKDEDAFRAFLLADEDHDKSREWFMSQA